MSRRSRAFFCDLHIHTQHSDGSQSVEEVLRLSHRFGLRGISITDHDSVAGITEAEMLNENMQLGLTVLSGVELSCSYNNLDVHILGYMFDHHDSQLLEVLTYYKTKREGRAHEMIKRLEQLGYPLDWERIARIANGGSIGRPHIGRALVDAGYFENIETVFDQLIGYRRPAYVPKEKLTPADAIRYLHQARGMAVLAHPGNYLDDTALQEFMANGIDGIEVFHPNHPNAVVMRLLKMAKDYDLLVTGGSDNHGQAKSDTYIGAVKVPYVYVENLQTFHQNRYL